MRPNLKLKKSWVGFFDGIQLTKSCKNFWLDTTTLTNKYWKLRVILFDTYIMLFNKLPETRNRNKVLVLS